MRYRIVVIFLSTLLAVSALADEVSIESKIRDLNQASIKSLGVSLNALTYLVNASPNSYMPLWHLEKSGDMQFIRELEKSGYVSVTITKGLPDGQIPNEEQVNITPLNSGREVQRCMLALKHNN